jgi:quinol monooxygenase YgiN
MIQVIASIRVKAGQRARFIEIFKANVPLVRGEDGCIEYFPAVDADTGMSVQQRDENVVTIIEKWRDLAALDAHRQAPHMRAYKERTKDLVESSSLKILLEA